MKSKSRCVYLTRYYLSLARLVRRLLYTTLCLVSRMRDSIMKDQDELMIRKSDCEELGLEANNKAVLEDVGHNADFYRYHQSRGQHARLGAGPAQSFG